MCTFVFIFIPLHIFYLSFLLLYEDSHLDPPHSHPYSIRSHLHSPHSHPYSPHSHPDSPHSHHFQPDSLDSHLIPCIPIIPTLIRCIHTLIPHIHIISTLIPSSSKLIPRIAIFPLIPFSDSPSRLLQIAYLKAVKQSLNLYF